MPLYDYKCPKCGQIEIERKIEQEPLKICPYCGKEIKRVYFAPGVQFNCKGFYSTDNKK